MRLLHLDSNGKLSFTGDLPERDLPQYAILSHTWGRTEDEVTYADIIDDTGKSKAGFAKIEFCIKRVRQDELEHFWIDTCCIDKRNNTELTEALNSMFRWYARSTKCYVYLAGIAAPTDSDSWEADFRQNRWFQRGWTLQELVAPSTVDFYTSTGYRLGSKSSLEALIAQTTRIPVQVLREYSSAQTTTVERRQWLQHRETGKPEDIVYCMLGLLEVSLPAIYGIGREEAQRKLDHELTIKHKGPRHTDFALNFSLPGVKETEHFVARRSELAKIHQHLASDGTRRYVVLQGLGGLGKTQLAIAYALQRKDDYSAILWLDAHNAGTVKASFVRIAKQILRTFPDTRCLASLDLDKDFDGAVNGVKTWLGMKMNKRWLLICDNFDNPRLRGEIDSDSLDLYQYLPEEYQGSILITTRSSLVTIGHCIPLQKLNLHEGLKILEHASRRGDLHDDSGAIAVATKLDGLPLALATAGAYLSQNSVSFTKYLEHHEQSWLRLQQASPQLLTYEDRDLYTTWNVSFAQIEQRDGIAANLLRLWAYLDGQDLWFELLADNFNEGRLLNPLPQLERPHWLKTLTQNELEFEQHIRVLCQYGLVSINADNRLAAESNGYNVHSCVHSWMLAALNTDREHNMCALAMGLVAAHVPTSGTISRTAVERRLVPHADRCLTSCRCTAEDANMPATYSLIGVLYRHQADWIKAEQLYTRAVRIGTRGGVVTDRGSKQVDGSCYSTLLTIAWLSDHYLDYVHGIEALIEKLLTTTMKASTHISGPSDSVSKACLSSLGWLYAIQGNLDKAEQILSARGSDFSETALREHLNEVWGAYLDFAIIRRKQNKPKEAEAMYLKMRTLALERYGQEHHIVHLANLLLAFVLVDQVRLEEAEEICCSLEDGRDKLGQRFQGDLISLRDYISSMAAADQLETVATPSSESETQVSDAGSAAESSKAAPPALTANTASELLAPASSDNRASPYSEPQASSTPKAPSTAVEVERVAFIEGMIAWMEQLCELPIRTSGGQNALDTINGTLDGTEL